MKKKGIVEIGDDQICLGERSSKSVLDLKLKPRSEAIYLCIALSFLNRSGIKIQTECLHAEFCAGESKDSRPTT